MKKEVVARFTWSKDEVRALLIEDLTRRGVEINGETSLRFTDMGAIFEVWLPTMPQDGTLGGGEGESKGRSASQAKGGT